MSITQKFYPSFFQKAFRGGDTFNVNEDCTTLEFQIALFREGAVYNKEHVLASEIPDAETLVIETSVKPATMTLSLDVVEEKLFFTLPEITWNYETEVSDPFRSAILFGPDGHLIMHIDFESDQTPSGDFSLVSNELCRPYMNLSYSPGCP